MQRRYTLAEAIALHDLMGFGHVVVSDGKGNVSDEWQHPYGPEIVYAEADDDGQLVKYPGASDFAVDMAGYGDWELLRGFTGQYSYNGAIMHESEFIGGPLERHIRENAGYYVAVIVDVFPTDNEGQGESENAGWAVAFKEISAPNDR